MKMITPKSLALRLAKRLPCGRSSSPRRHIWQRLPQLLLLLAIAACESPGSHQGHESFLARLERKAAAAPAPDMPVIDLPPDSLLAGLTFAEVRNPGPMPPFSVATRLDKLTQFPCSQCHTLPLDKMKGALPDSLRRAHWTIRQLHPVDVALHRVHAGDEVLRCVTCHNADNLDVLTSLTGREIAFDHSYQLCAQCHAQQHKDWLGGAHGKRLSGWLMPRVVQNCTGCHDPHQPRWPKRWPAQLSGSQP